MSKKDLMVHKISIERFKCPLCQELYENEKNAKNCVYDHLSQQKTCVHGKLKNSLENWSNQYEEITFILKRKCMNCFIDYSSQNIDITDPKIIDAIANILPVVKYTK